MIVEKRRIKKMRWDKRENYKRKGEIMSKLMCGIMLYRGRKKIVSPF